MSALGNIRENTLTLRKAVAASRELLWTYVSTASGLSCWQADTVEGDLTSGSFSLRWPSLGARLDLSLGSLEQGKRILLRAGTTALEMRVGDGWIELTHAGLDSEDDYSGFESSWNTALALLELAALKHPRRTRTVRWLFLPLEASADLLHFYFTDKTALSTWLGTPTSASMSPLKQPSSYELAMFGGGTLSGNVLHSARDVCLHVSEWENGALVLRSLPGPQGSRICALGVSTWEFSLPEKVMDSLDGALKRLSQASQSRD